MFLLEFLPLFGRQDLLQPFVVLRADLLQARFGFLPHFLDVFAGFAENFLDLQLLRVVQTEAFEGFFVPFLLGRRFCRAEP